VITAIHSWFHHTSLLLNDIKSKDDEIANLKKKVEELQREKLNAMFVSLQEEITEYREILYGWKEQIVNTGSPMKKAYEPTSKVREPEPVEEEEEEENMDIEYDDGLLHKEHIHCLRLQGKPTVILSGSYTAAGSITEDGIVGLPRAFIAAGAKSVFATMWATQDESAPFLMKELHKQLKTPGTSQSQALRAAMLALQQQDGGKYAHPVHWAGLTLLGNPKAL